MSVHIIASDRLQGRWTYLDEHVAAEREACRRRGSVRRDLVTPADPSSGPTRLEADSHLVVARVDDVEIDQTGDLSEPKRNLRSDVRDVDRRSPLRRRDCSFDSRSRVTQSASAA